MTTTVILDQTNLIEWLTKILEFVKRWLKVKVEVESGIDGQDRQKDLSEYEKYMKMIEEDMKKEGIKFEREDPEKIWRRLKSKDSYFKKLEKDLEKKWLLIK